MTRARPTFARYRGALLALGVSAALHAALFLGLPTRLESIGDPPAATYTASLDAASAEIVDAPPAAVTAPRPARATPRPPRSRSLPLLPDSVFEPLPALARGPDIAALSPQPARVDEADARPEVVALAQPATPVPALEPERFPSEALPANLSISYVLVSPFAEGRAEYNWSREGDNYTITGEAEATGFFTLFLEGRILQESRGTVTAKGLRPERFLERKPNTVPEGLAFDWPAGQVTMDRGDRRNSTPLVDNTVDWLSMIFQLAHQPPKGRSLDLRVFTQRKFYKFHLKVLGEEEISIPMGKVRALHLRHVDAQDPTEVVDVWLGIEHHYLPVKLRYPVARNRLMVEQLATKVTAR